MIRARLNPMAAAAAYAAEGGGNMVRFISPKEVGGAAADNHRANRSIVDAVNRRAGGEVCRIRRRRVDSRRLLSVDFKNQRLVVHRSNKIRRRGSKVSSRMPDITQAAAAAEEVSDETVADEC